MDTLTPALDTGQPVADVPERVVEIKRAHRDRAMRIKAPRALQRRLPPRVFVAVQNRVQRFVLAHRGPLRLAGIPAARRPHTSIRWATAPNSSGPPTQHSTASTISTVMAASLRSEETPPAPSTPPWPPS